MTHSLRIAPLLLLACISTAWAQGDVGKPPPNGSGAERARIDTIRQKRLVELDTEDVACFSKFAVTDCQNKVGMRRRQMLADLKRQEAKLNEAERQQKVAEQSQKALDKAAENARRELDVQSDTAKTTEEERQKNLNEKVLNHNNQAKLSKAAGIKSPSAPDAATVNKNRAAHQDKVKELEKRRHERDKRLKDQGSGSAPLPVAP